MPTLIDAPLSRCTALTLSLCAGCFAADDPSLLGDTGTDTDTGTSDDDDDDGNDDTDTTAETDDPQAPGHAPKLPPILADFTINGSDHPAPITDAMVVELQASFAPASVAAHVDFFVDGQRIASVHEAPYLAYWIADSEAADGDHEFEAVALTDDDLDDRLLRTVTVDLPAPGSLRWSIDAPLDAAWRDLAALPEGVALLADATLALHDHHGQQRWQRPLPFTAQALAVDPIRGELLIAGAEDDDLHLARVDRDGALLDSWVLTDLVPGLQFIDLDAHAGRAAISGRRQGISPDKLPFLAMVDLDQASGQDLLEPAWLLSFTALTATLSVTDNPAFTHDGAVLLSVTHTLLDDQDLPYWRSELHRVGPQGQDQLLYTHDSAWQRLGTVAAGDDRIFLGGEDGSGGVVTALDLDGAWQASNAKLGEVVTVVQADRGGSIWAAPIWSAANPDLLVGRTNAAGDIDWQVELASDEWFKELPRAIDADDLGHVYVLTQTVGEVDGLRVLALHP